jgi:hypothetical protein
VDVFHRDVGRREHERIDPNLVVPLEPSKRHDVRDPWHSPEAALDDDVLEST